MPSPRSALYASSVHHVLVLQEEDMPEDEAMGQSKEEQGGVLRVGDSRDTILKRKHKQEVRPWRISTRMRTATAALVICLNIGVAPPDVIKPNPCAKLECWTDPTSDNAIKSLHRVASALKAQYEQWQMKAKYKLCADPTISELKKTCVSLRRVAKEERVLFHYNGHGVPKPTRNGEIWAFNQNYTQYIPLSLSDLRNVLGSPSVLIFDCNSAGILQHHFKKLSEHLERQWQQSNVSNPDETGPPLHRNSILLGACGQNELLPMNPRLPADVFTACLTTPIKMLLLWFCQRTLISEVTPEMLDRIPGSLSKRQTPLGEMNWVFTAVTDAIGWSVLSREKFKFLFRQDLMLASLMRNYLLAHRIMRSYGCTPVSFPEIPETHTHPLWQACDLAVEQLLSQLPTLIAAEDAKLRNAGKGEVEATEGATNQTARELGQSTHPDPSSQVPQGDGISQHLPSTSATGKQPSGKTHEGNSSSTEHAFTSPNGYGSVYIPSTFFEDQMKAFDVWLDMGPDQRDPPEQLPIMLQALLSPHHRVKSLPLLSKYLQTGPVAVDLALSVGIFPYLQQLLRSRSTEMHQHVVFIWSKVLALDDTCRVDLVKEKGEEFFVRFLTQSHSCNNPPKPVYLAVAMFVLSVVARSHADRCCEVGTLEACYDHIDNQDKFVRRWACLCLSMVIRNASPPIQSRVLAWDDLLLLLRQRATEDVAPDVRAAATSTLSVIMGGILKLLSPRAEAGACAFTNEYQPSDLIPGNEIVGEGRMSASSITSDLSVSAAQEAEDRAPMAKKSHRDNQVELLPTETGIPNDALSGFSTYERDTILKLGSAIAEIGKRESSVLVRREVAIAIAKAARHRSERFIRAAICIDIIGMDDSQESYQQTDVEKCERIYLKMWMMLSELAFDPHPVVAALARRSYDMISEPLTQKYGLTREWVRNTARADLPPTDHAFSPPQNRQYDCPALDATESATQFYMNQSDYVVSSEAQVTNSSERTSLEGATVKPGALTNQSGCSETKCSTVLGRPANVQTQMDRIHVRSTSGSFDLNVSSRLPYLSAMPRVHSASLIRPVTDSPHTKRIPVAAANSQIGASSSIERVAQAKKDEPSSLPKIALAKGVGMLMKTVSEQLNLPGLGNALNTLPQSFGSSSSADTRGDKEESEAKPLFLPRPPRRSLSYQVLNAASTLLPEEEITVIASSRPTYFASVEADVSDESLENISRKLPRGYERLYLSGHGDAALSLYEWGSAHIARVEFDAATTDSRHEARAVPRYAVLWDRFLKTSGKIPPESLRAFALLGGGTNGMGVRSNVADDEEGTSLKFSEISTYAMGAGGGAVTAMAFLPRDIGMGDDQLIATGDGKGSVGIYDIRSGSCQGSLGIPSPPGIPEVGVSTILCLNRPTPTAWDTSFSLGNSRSALILAGAYDGRVAVFKSHLQGQKYRIMSTFQASGQSYWSKVGTSREPRFKPSQHNVMNGTQLSPESSGSFSSGSVTFADTVRESGNGLVLAFDSDSSYLAAAGCDSENVRIWDLSREQCIWEGAAVSEGTWPTAVTMWGRINRSVFVVGASNGQVNVVDLRERASLAKRAEPLVRMGTLSEPIISLGTCPPVGRYAAEVVVSANVGGEIVFWDTRWNSTTGVTPGARSEPELSRIKAHRNNLSAMAVHPLGTLIASGSTARCVKVFGRNRNMLKMLCCHETGGGLSEADNRIPPVTSLSFQPESNLLAIGAIDGSVMIYGQPDSFPGVRAREDQVTDAERAALHQYWR